MKKHISLMNAQTIYYLWKNQKTRKYILKLIEEVTSESNLKLLDTINYNNLHIRSHILFENKDSIFLIDFSHNRMINKVKLNQDIIKFLKYITNKKVMMILFCNYLGRTRIENDIHYVYRHKDNSQKIKLLMSKTLTQQLKYDDYNVVEYLYNLDKKFYQKYLEEFKNEENIYKLLDL